MEKVKIGKKEDDDEMRLIGFCELSKLSIRTIQGFIKRVVLWF
jgi:hypothetical protein